jgi:molecular chaperone DnaK (HSP70)
MRLGIDFGTTRVVVAHADRGNFPLVSFEAPDGQVHDWFPPVVAVNGEPRLYGWDAIAVEEDESWTILRSLKRYLRSANPHTQVTVGGQTVPLRQLMAEMMRSLRATDRALESGRDRGATKRPRRILKSCFEVMLGVPANANSNQRFLTEEAAQAAGFTVLGLLNEPSAAAIEFAHRNSAERKSRAGSGLVVYDLGGGTFDVSLVTMGETEHTVVASDGIPNLGGDDFDEILARRWRSNPSASTASCHRWRSIACSRNAARRRRALNPNTRKVTIDLERVRAGWEQVTIPVDAYYERCRPLIEQTRVVVENLLAAHSTSARWTRSMSPAARPSCRPWLAFCARTSGARCAARLICVRPAPSALPFAPPAIRRPAIRHFRPDRCRTSSIKLRHLARDRFGGTILFDLIFARGVQLPAPGEPPLAHRARLPAGAQYRPLSLS